MITLVEVIEGPSIEELIKSLGAYKGGDSEYTPPVKFRCRFPGNNSERSVGYLEFGVRSLDFPWDGDGTSVLVGGIQAYFCELVEWPNERVSVQLRELKFHYVENPPAGSPRAHFHLKV